jgi:hypothetical protein
MTPDLPPNPMTITPPPRMVLTAEGVYQRFKGRKVDARLFAEVREELKVIRAWDSYERSTSPLREGAKRALRRILDQER